MAELVSGAGFPTALQGQTDNELPFLKVGDLGRMDSRGYFAAPPDTIAQATANALGAAVIAPHTPVMAKIGAAISLRRVGVTSAVCCIDNNMVAAIPRTGTHSRYLYYVLNLLDPALLLNGGAVPNINMNWMRHTSLPWFSYEVQRQIADYLDHETAEIDAFIADLELTRLISTEKWRTFRNSLLSGGRRAEADSRTWFARMDPNWRVGALKHLFSVTLGKMLDEKQQQLGEAFPYVRAANIGDGVLDLRSVNTMTFDSREREKYALRRGDVLVVEGGSVGTNVVLSEDIGGIYFQKTVNRLRPRNGASSRFYSEVINAYREAGVFDVFGNRSTIMHLTAEKLEALRVPIPDVTEQHRIAATLQSARTSTEAANADIDAAIALAKERRASLITAVVTGQIDVTTTQLPTVNSIQSAIEEAR